MGPAAGGRNRVPNLGTEEVEPERLQPLPRQPVQDRPTYRPTYLGRVRLPLAGPYRPWVRLYRTFDGSVYATARLWEIDRTILRRVDLDTLRKYARASGLRAFANAIDRLVENAGRGRLR